MKTVKAISYGPEVRALLTPGGGRVLALLSNVIYLESFEGYVVGIVGEEAVEGPLSLRVRDLRLLVEELRGRVDLPFRCSGPAIDLGGVACVSLQGAREWTPRLPGRLGGEAERDEAARVLVEAVVDYVGGRTAGGEEGPTLADLVRLCDSRARDVPMREAGHEAYHLRFFAALRMTKEKWDSKGGADTAAGRVVKRVADGAAGFVEALGSGNVGGAGEALAPLIGLGMGLTPSGDDLVSGVLASLVWRARAGEVDKGVPRDIVGRVSAVLERSNRISTRLLHHAGEGVLYAPAMELGAALLVGDVGTIREPARRLFGIGNTSGVDLAAGLLIGCLAGQLSE